MDGRFVCFVCLLGHKDKPMTDDRARFFVTAHQTSLGLGGCSINSTYSSLF
jgi:hypothetical protein